MKKDGEVQLSVQEFVAKLKVWDVNVNRAVKYIVK